MLNQSGKLSGAGAFEEENGFRSTSCRACNSLIQHSLWLNWSAIQLQSSSRRRPACATPTSLQPTSITYELRFPTTANDLVRKKIERGLVEKNSRPAGGALASSNRRAASFGSSSGPGQAQGSVV